MTNGQGYLVDNMQLPAEMKTHNPIMLGDRSVGRFYIKIFEFSYRYSDYAQNNIRGSTPYSQSNFQL